MSSNTNKSVDEFHIRFFCECGWHEKPPLDGHRFFVTDVCPECGTHKRDFTKKICKKENGKWVDTNNNYFLQDASKDDEIKSFLKKVVDLTFWRVNPDSDGYHKVSHDTIDDLYKEAQRLLDKYREED